MIDRAEAMAICVAVTDAGSFTAAGRKLNIPLPTVSRKLGELEAHLGTSLFTRSTRRLALTEAGAARRRRSSPKAACRSRAERW